MYGIHITPVVRRLARRTEGQDLIEYALLIGMISVALLLSISGIGASVTQMYGNTSAALNGAPAAPPGSGDPSTGNPGGNPGNSGNPPGNSGNPPGNSDGNPGNGNSNNPGNSGNPGNPGKGKG